MKTKVLICLVTTILVSTTHAGPLKDGDVKGSDALDEFPLIDGHNDLPYNFLSKVHNQINGLDFTKNLTDDPIFGSKNCSSCFTDIPRMKKGKLGGQFWVAYVDCKKEDSISRTMDQIDVIKRFINSYPNDLKYVDTADGILDAFKEKKIASMIVVEGGHSIDSKLSVLRLYHELGVRYMTLTHTCNLPWADGSPVDADNSFQHNLTEFGERVVLEMNRLGIMVDLSHVSYAVMNKALDVSKAPVIFSHSSSYAIHPHHRNVRDDVLQKLKVNNGVIMVNFYSAFIGSGNVTIHDVANHINHIVDQIGVDHVGIGSDYDGVDRVPVGLEDVSKYPDLFDLLHNDNPTRWTIDNLKKLAGQNLYRVFKAVEGVRDNLRAEKPDETLLDVEEIDGQKTGGQESVRPNLIVALLISLLFFLKR